ncbi:hypothetical protein [Streptomyces sp. NPDC056480]|uniref:hypothetical protein n=1 Tax=Streptomyces sp. NPDC056480 TaxID=3345833 RepID=UPI0036C104F2
MPEEQVACDADPRPGGAQRHLPAGLTEWFPEGKNLAQAHCDALRKAVPASDVMFFSDYLLDDSEFALRCMEIAADAMPHLWRRMNVPDLGVVDVASQDSGRHLRRGWPSAQPGSWSDINRVGVFGVTGEDYGWLVPVEVMCLMMAVLDGRRFDTAEVYHLSGVHMINYISSIAPVIHDLYVALADELDLPSTLTFHIAPSANMTLGVPANDRVVLDHLVDCYLDAQENRQSLAGRQSVQAERFRALSRLNWAADSCAVPFFDVREANYFSQYDLLAQDAEWYMSPWALETPLGEVGRMVSTVSKLRNPGK